MFAVPLMTTVQKKCLLEDTFIFAYPFLADVSIYTPLKTLKTKGFHNLSFT